MINEVVFGPKLDLPPGRALRRYLIMSSPRTGSSMLSDALIQTGLAGVPLEYLNELVLARIGDRLTFAQVFAHLDEVNARRTSANGVFGMKMHYHQFANLFLTKDGVNEAGQRFISQFSDFILINRRDRISQAISYVIALDKGNWNTSDKAAAHSSTLDLNEPTAIRILSEMAFLMRETRAWRRLIAARNLRAMEVVYEDMVTDFPACFSGVLSFLGLPDVAASPQTVKLGGSRTRAVKKQFLDMIGSGEDGSVAAEGQG